MTTIHLRKMWREQALRLKERQRHEYSRATRQLAAKIGDEQAALVAGLMLHAFVEGFIEGAEATYNRRSHVGR